MKLIHFKNWLFVFLFLVIKSYGQQNTITIDKSSTSVGEVIELLERTTRYNFVYKVNSINLKRNVLITIVDGSIQDILNLLFKDSDIQYIIRKNQVILKKNLSKKSNSNLIVSSENKIRIKGKIVDEENNPLYGASVLEKNTKNGTVSNFDGEFNLDVFNNNPILIVANLGYTTKEFPINDSIDLTLKLHEESLALDEIVVIGYGTQKKSDASGATSSIQGIDLEDTIFASVANQLQGRASGVSVTTGSGEPGGGLDVTIRGLNSLMGTNQPLYILDGIPLNLDIQAADDRYFTETNPLASLNPNDIESIEVLKDASSTAIYGSRASNGVVLLSTKTAKSGKTQINGLVRTTVFFPKNAYNLLNAPQYNQVRNDAALLDNPTRTFDELVATGDIKYPNIDIHAEGTDFMDQLLQSGFMKEYSLSLSGGNESYTQLLSLNYYNQEGVVLDSKFKRANIRYNSKFNITSQWSLTSNMQLNHIRNQRIVNSTKTGLTGVIFNAFRIDPNNNLLNNDGNFLDEDEYGDFIANPISNALFDDTVLENKDLILGFSSTYKFFNNLLWTTRIGFIHRLSDNNSFADTRTARGRQDNARLFVSDAKLTSATLESFLNYNKALGKQNLTAVLGVGYEDFNIESTEHTYFDFTFDNLGVNAIQLAKKIGQYNSRKTNFTLQSAFFRVGYNFNNKYLFTINGRVDGTSKFINGTPWGFFPSAAIAWNIKKEPLLSTINAVSQFKLRASYGLTGSQSGVNPLASQAIYRISKIGLADDNLYTASYPSGISNKNLTWETNKSFDVGLDFGLLKNRISGSIDWYLKTTDNLLNNIPIPAQTGFESVSLNRGALKNRGLEITLNFNVIRSQKLKWTSEINWTTNKTFLSDYGSQKFAYGPDIATNFFSEPVSKNYVGDEIGKFYGYNIIGLIQIDDLVDYENGDFTPRNDIDGNPVFVSTGINRPGNWIFEDIDGDGQITITDKKIIGNPNPDFFFGWSNNFSMGSFKISALIQGSIGNDVLNINKGFTGVGWAGANSTKEWYNHRWTIENQHNNVNFPSNQISNAVKGPNSVYVEDGSYVRLQNLTVSYAIPTKNKKSHFNVSLIGSNLITLTNYSGSDPEVSTNRGNAFSRGVDYSAYPRAKGLSLGLDFNF